MLVIGTSYEPLTGNPLYNTGTLPDFERLVFNGLVDLNPKFAPVPDLAANWTVSSDQKTFTFNLRHDVKFQDGVALTAQDVVFTYQKFANPAIGSAIQSLFTNMTVSAPDDHTVVFQFAQPNPAFLVNAWYGILPKHLLDNVADADMKNANFSTHPVGTGPFKLVNWIAQSELDLVANDNYFRGRPHIDKIIFKIIPDTTALVTAIKANEVDLWTTFSAAGGLSPSQVQQANHTGYYVQEYPGTTMEFYMGPQNRAPWNNTIVRQAFLYAINRTELINKFLPGAAQPWDSPFNTPWAVDPKLQPVYNYDPAKAQQLLDQAGFKPGSDGVRISVNLYATTGFRTLFSQLIASQLSKVGIKATVVTVGDFTAYWNLLSSERTESGIWTVFQNINADPLYQAAELLPENISPGGLNIAAVNDSQLTQILHQAATASDSNQRAQLYYQAEAIIAQKALGWDLWLTKGFNIVNSKLQGYVGTPVQGMEYMSLENATIIS